ncbi:MAG: hypothetical protein DWI02_03825 [Planctomycetota bacterium]|nr:MAG: hypothetical protein DWI02_03825 [Planctomycetota bacterium]
MGSDSRTLGDVYEKNRRRGTEGVAQRRRSRNGFSGLVQIMQAGCRIKVFSQNALVTDPAPARKSHGVKLG